MVLGDLSAFYRGAPASFDLKATQGRPARHVTLVAAQVPANPFERFIVLLDQIAGILVVVAAAWLVWTRPGRMSWGFFLCDVVQSRSVLRLLRAPRAMAVDRARTEHRRRYR